ncbi:MAG: IS200/IS605 family element transposase accessory protein TnpB [Pleurocapsa sp. SU_196_0]|nr:IS200/IS605 family element transposase accessory protein TnpB [Pleurocapsa sp. SU_196_0]
MLKAYKYRFYPTRGQAEMLSKQFGCSRFVYNWALNEKVQAYQRTGKSPTRYELDKRLTTLKKELPWLTEVASQPLQQAIIHLERAFTKFFKEKKGFPKFHSKHTHNSASYPQGVRVDFESNRITIPKLGKVKAKLSRGFEGQIRTCTVNRNAAGHYHISVLVEVENQDAAPTLETQETAVGVDLGIKHFAVLSTGERIENPRHLSHALARLQVLSRRHSRTKKGGANREKARRKLARAHQRVTDCRNDFLHKESTKLIREFDTVCLETLNVAGMVKNHRLARYISDASWGRFGEFLEYKAGWYGKHVRCIGRFEPSSKLCACGTIKRELRLSDRVWTCASCGAIHDRDVLAAQNIKRFAFIAPRDTREGLREA